MGKNPQMTLLSKYILFWTFFPHLIWLRKKKSTLQETEQEKENREEYAR